jgi:dihydropteroate synthase
MRTRNKTTRKDPDMISNKKSAMKVKKMILKLRETMDEMDNDCNYSWDESRVESSKLAITIAFSILNDSISNESFVSTENVIKMISKLNENISSL